VGEKITKLKNSPKGEFLFDFNKIIDKITSAPEKFNIRIGFGLFRVRIGDVS